MKLTNYLLLILLFTTVFIFVNADDDLDDDDKIEPWCWTKPVKDVESIDHEEGGVNWGYCQLPEVNDDGTTTETKIPYKIYVVTPNIPGSGAQGGFYITMFGSEGETDEVLLTNEGFDEGSTAILDVVASNVGDISKIIVRNGGSDSYSCAKVRVELGTKFWDFDCQGEIACPKHCTETMTLTGSQKYDIQVSTAAEENAGTDSAIYITLLGEDGKTARKILTEDGFDEGATDDIKLNAKDVGTIYGIILAQTQNDPWKPQSIQVQRAGQETTIFDPKGEELNCPLKCALTIINPKPEKGHGEVADGSDGTGGGMDDPDASSEDDEGGDDGDSSQFLGSGLSSAEKNALLNFNCDTVVKDNPDFGPDVIGAPNYALIMGKCPAGCSELGDAKVIGIGIHPANSGICKSAIYDQSMPFAGGVVGVGITPGLSKYSEGRIISGLQAKSGGPAKKSFYTIKVDNIDMALQNVRIVDYQGLISATGRLEMRSQGVWGSVCVTGTDNSAARTICRSLKFLDGQMKNGAGEQANICSQFKGEFYCGVAPMKIHFMALKCEPGQTNIWDCYRELAEGCDHNQDVLIECVMIDYDKPQVPDEGTVRVVDHQGSPSSDGGGRVEVYKNGWGTICNSGFNAKSAQVVCKQMGYDDGNIVGEVNQNGVCSNFKGENHCGKDDAPIVRKDMECQGNEKTFFDCGGNKDTTSCNHEQDAMVICNGDQGDATGMSQKLGGKAVPLPPQLGRLPFPPIIQAECSTTGEEPILRGDPGSVYLIQCPKGCTSADASIYGTGIYLLQSSICKAAIHSGVLQDLGGVVEFIKKEGIEKYLGSENRDITSMDFEKWQYSFCISKPITAHIQSASDFAQSTPVMFSQINQKVVLKKLNQKSMLFKNYIKSVAFGSDTEPIPVFLWIAEPGFKFNGQENVLDTKELPGNENVGTIETFTILTKVRLTEDMSGNVLTIAGHSSCGCWALVVNEKGTLDFEVRCDGVIFSSGFSMPLMTDVAVAVTYDGSEAAFYVNGGLSNKQKVLFDLKCGGDLDIGSYGVTQSQIFKGTIYYLEIFDQAFDQKMITKLTAKGDPQYPKAPATGDAADNVPLVGVLLTLDERTCLAVCTTNNIPGTPDAPSPPPEAQLGQPDYGPGATVQEGLPDDGKGGKAQPVLGAGIEITCDVNGDDKLFVGPTGKAFRVECPRGCGKLDTGSVIGSMIYVDESAVCKSAVHAGFLKDQEGGEFMFVVANGEKEYESSNQNEIQSASFGSAARSFVIKEAPGLVNVKCETKASDPTLPGLEGTKISVLCPSKCSRATQSVFGYDVYSDDSSICQAAIQMGLLTDLGGEVTFAIGGAMPNFEARVKNGITSSKKQGHNRTFKIVGDKRHTCSYFHETYQPTNIFKNWQKQDVKGARNGPSQWTYTSNPTQYGLAFKQMSNIVGTDMAYGSVLVNKNFDCNDGMLKFNVFFESLGPTAIVFRYYDSNNFYALELNTPGQKKLRLVKKSEGENDQIKDADIFFSPAIWYRFRIVFHESNIQIWMQTGNLRNIERIMNIEDADVQRGTVGIAAQGHNGIYFDGIAVEHYDHEIGISDPSASRRRVWDQCLTDASKQHREKFCKGIYGVYKAGIIKCKKLYNYCEQCCDQVIPKLEKVLNYACWRGCINEAKASGKREAEAKLAEAELLAELAGDYIPEEGDNVDFKPSGENTFFVPAKIKEITENKGSSQKLIVEYFEDGAPKTQKVSYPDPNLTACGKTLTSRADCAD